MSMYLGGTMLGQGRRVAGGTTITSGLLAARPAAGTADSYYFATDVEMLFRDNGVVWELVSAAWQGEYVPSRWERFGAALNVTANRVYLVPVARFQGAITIDALRFVQSTVRVGNAILGLYGRGTTTDYLPDGAPLVATTGAAGFAIPNNMMNEQALAANYQMVASQNFIGVDYWFAIVCSAAGNALFNVSDTPFVGAASRVEAKQYNAGAFQLTDPCPATIQATICTYFEARVLSIP